MPIKPIVLQRRHAELGRIRLGYKATTANGGSRPAKLETFRFTSVSESYIRDLATLYGGEPKPWDNAGIASWEVYTEAKSVPVIAVKGGLSQWMETWSGGGCVHRCDGETQVDGTPCDPKDRAHIDARPTTRLSLMLPELEAIGVWRCETHGWNAAAEIPAVAELAQFVGDLVPANLDLVERRAIKDGKTSRFVVPVLDLQIGTARLREIVAQKSGTAAALEAGTTSAAAIEAPARDQQPAEQQVKIPTAEQIAGFDLDTARRALAYLDQKAPDHPARDAVYDRVCDLEPDPDAEGVVDAELVDDGAQSHDEDAIWQQILTVAGRLGMSLPDTEDHFASQMGGVDSASASAAELQHYLDLLTAREAGEAVPA